MSTIQEHLDRLTQVRTVVECRPAFPGQPLCTVRFREGAINRTVSHAIASLERQLIRKRLKHQAALERGDEATADRLALEIADFEWRRQVIDQHTPDDG